MTSDILSLNERLERLLEDKDYDQALTLLDRELGPHVRLRLQRRYPSAAEMDVAAAWQDALTALWDGLRLRPDAPPDNPSGWLARTAQNRLIDHIRREHARKEVQEPLEAVAAPDDPEPFDEWPEATRKRAMELLAQMPNPERAILSLRILLGWRLREVAEAVKMPRSTISAKVFSGLQKLREDLNGELE